MGMRKLLLILLLVALCFASHGQSPMSKLLMRKMDPPPPTGCTNVLTSGYEVSGDINNSHGQLGQGSLSTTTFLSGAASFKSFVNSSTLSHVSSGWRAEVQYEETESQDGDAIEVEYDLNFESISIPSTGGLAVQWHGNASGTSGQLSLWIGGGEFMVMRSVSAGINQYQGSGGGQPPFPAGGAWSITTGHWYHFKWEVKFTTTITGYVKLWIDGTLYYNATGVKTSDGTGQYLKIGQNLFDPPPGNSIMYYDNLTICKY